MLDGLVRPLTTAHRQACVGRYLQWLNVLTVFTQVVISKSTSPCRGRSYPVLPVVCDAGSVCAVRGFVGRWQRIVSLWPTGESIKRVSGCLIAKMAKKDG